MLGRLLDAVIHPLIHVGYGVEFGLPGMVIEGNTPLPAYHEVFLSRNTQQGLRGLRSIEAFQRPS